MSLISRVDTLLRDSSGTVAILFGLCTLILSMFVGLALDSSRAYNVSSRVQAALDAAALAGAKAMDVEGATAASIQEAAKRFFDSYVPRIDAADVGLANFRTTPDWSTSTVVAEVDVSMSSIFGAVSQGASKMNFTPAAQVSYKALKIELSLVVDLTGSMCDAPPAVTDPPCTSGAKLDALKLAANDMVDALFESDPNVGAVKIALVPYSASVNAGGYAAAVSDGASTDGCVVERSGAAATTNAIANSSAPLGTSNTGAAYFYSCVPTEVVPLTELSNSGQRTAFKAAINNLRATGGTAGHIGLAWGWYLLSPEWNSIWPGNPARAYDSKNVIKAVVLMTDGDFNISYANGGESIAWPDPLASDPTAVGSSGHQALALCDAMRNAGSEDRNIKIYTVAFQAPPVAEAMLKQCSGVDNYYDTTSSSQLNAAFKDIVKRLNSLRVTS